MKVILQMVFLMVKVNGNQVLGSSTVYRSKFEWLITSI